MALPYDSAPKFQDYAHPEMLVSTEWLAEHLDDPGLVVAESDEDVLLYETGHIPGAVKLDWHTELNDPQTRDYVDGTGFARLMSERGITRDTTLVLYESPHRILATLEAVAEVFGTREIVVARELTKQFEEVVRAPATAHHERLTAAGVRGEFTLVIPAE